MTPASGDTDFAPVDAGLHGIPHTDAPVRKRGLGVGSVVFLVVSAAAPMTTAAVSVPTTIAITQNIGMPLFYLIAGAVLLLFSVGFTLMTRHVHHAGAFYSYVQAGLGRITGMGAATLAVVSYYLLQVSLVIFLGVGTSNIILTYTGAAVPWLPLSVAFLALVTFLGYRDVELSAKVLGVLLVIETLAVVLLDVVIAGTGGADGVTLESFSPDVFSQGAPVMALMFAFLGFVGFEATAVFRNEARDPGTTIPRATYISVIVIASFYAFTSWMIVVGEGAANVVAAASADPSSLVVILAGQYVSPIMFNILQVLLVTSVFAAALSFHSVISRYQFTLAQGQVLPRALGVLHHKHHAPSASSLVVTAITLVLLLVIGFSGLDPLLEASAWLSGAAILGIMTLMALTSASVIVFFARTRLATGLWSTIVAPGFATLALGGVVFLVLSNFALLVGSPLAAVLIEAALAMAFLGGVVIALVLRRRRPTVYKDLINY